MGIRDFFGKRDSKETDSVTRLNLSDLKPGWMVDRMGRTYEVTAYNAYEWGEGDRTDEWQLQDGTETVYLEREFDDENDWSLNRKISFRGLGPGIAERIAETGDPPEELVHEGRRYYLEEAAGGHFLKDGKGPRQPMLRWSYETTAAKIIWVSSSGTRRISRPRSGSGFTSTSSRTFSRGNRPETAAVAPLAVGLHNGAKYANFGV
jgi:hypothetical protein